MDFKTTIHSYKSDSGNRDLSTSMRLDKNILYEDILMKAKELKALLIVRTSYVNEQKPGAWYIKGYNGRHPSYEEIKLKIEQNVTNKKYKKRECYLIEYLQN